ncbi:MAG TPA: hypothetical protein V6D16_22860 [Candidatus Obscuribacterales bacterium]
MESNFLKDAIANFGLLALRPATKVTSKLPSLQSTINVLCSETPQLALLNRQG